MKALFHCSHCKKDTVHVVVSTQIIGSNFHTKLKCEDCDEPPFNWIEETTGLKASQIYLTMNKKL